MATSDGQLHPPKLHLRQRRARHRPRRGDEDPSGVTPNDPQDPDPGPNLLQNFPIITSATTPDGSSASIQGTLNSNPNDSFTIQFFSSPEADPSGYGEGKTYLGQTNVTVNAGGNAAFSFSANVSVAAGKSSPPPPPT